jgi:hypothetical protein
MLDRISDVTISVLISSTVDRGFKPQSGQTKDYKKKTTETMMELNSSNNNTIPFGVYFKEVDRYFKFVGIRKITLM